jgi:pimeloyl-ACP methyl ester carboxylesterase
MTRASFFRIVVCLVFGGLQSIAGAQEKSASIGGTWQGTLSLGVAKLRLVFELKKKDDGGLTGTLDSPDQNVFGLSIDEVTVKEQSVKLVLGKINGSYEGKLSDDGQQIDGKWKQGPLALPLVLKPGEKIGPPKRPQEPKTPYPYATEEVTFENTEASIKFAGTLTLPKGEGTYPAVILISGSGPQDRNEELMGHKPFLVWADYLTRRGVAVLRVDDRGVGGSGGKPGVSTIEEHVGDALAAIAYLKGRSDIDVKKIGLIGHSEGGLVAPAAAVKSHDVAFIVLLAGTGVVGEEILYSQGKLINKAMGLPEDSIAKVRDLQDQLFAVIKENADPAAAAAKVATVIAERLSRLTADERKAIENMQALAEAQTKMLVSPWFRHFLMYDPRPTLEKVQCPVLAICGEKDLQVDPKLNLPPMEAALKKANNKDVTIKELPGLNHLFQASETGSLAEYQKIEETINPAALEAVGQWLAAHGVGK